MKARVDGYQGLYKDLDTGMIQNHSNIERTAYRRAKKQALDHIEQKGEMQEIRQELAELKTLLREVLKNNGT